MTSSLDTPQSEQLNLIPTAAESCENAPPTDGSPVCACTKETFGCSIHPNTPAEWIASQRECLANLLASPEKERARRTIETCGTKPSESLMLSGQDMSFLKTYPAFSAPETLKAYLAGLLDGEGYIGITKREKHAGAFYIDPVAQVEMTEKGRACLEMFTRIVPTVKVTPCKKGKTPRHADSFRFYTAGGTAVRLLWTLLPYLILKRKQAEVAIHCWINKADAESGITEIKRLNKKGPVSLENGAIAKLENGKFVTAQMNLDGSSAELTDPFPRWGMTRAGQLYPLPMLALRTCASGGGALQNVPTPTANDAEKRGDFDPVRSWGTAGFAKMWPTPTVPNGGRTMTPEMAQNGGYTAEGRKRQVGLENAVKFWPTPTASLGTNGGLVTPSKSREGGTLIEAVSARAFATPTTRDYKSGSFSPEAKSKRDEHSRGKPLSEQIGGKLNPVWVEWLMDWPLGWTGLKQPATGKSRSRVRSRGESSGARE